MGRVSFGGWGLCNGRGEQELVWWAGPPLEQTFKPAA